MLMYTSKIDEWYMECVKLLITGAELCIPTAIPGRLKHWWDAEASDLKGKAFFDAKIWAESGTLTTGLLFDNMMPFKKMYKKTFPILY